MFLETLAAISAVTAIQAGTAVAGAGVAAYGVSQQSKYQKQSSQASQVAEDARRRAARLDALRKQREIIRNAQVARATGLSRVAAQGAQFGSALSGVEGQVAGEAGVMSTAVRGNLGIAETIFDANAVQARAQGQAATGQATYAFGKELIQNAPMIAKIGSSLFPQTGGWTTTTTKAA